jgi:hypothetical protein
MSTYKPVQNDTGSFEWETQFEEQSITSHLEGI